MERYRVLIKPSAKKELLAIATKKNRQRVVAKIQALAQEPRPPGCEKLAGRNRYRIRQGNYRIVYAIEDQSLIVLVIKVGHRRDVYRSS